MTIFDFVGGILWDWGILSLDFMSIERSLVHTVSSLVAILRVFE